MTSVLVYIHDNKHKLIKCVIRHVTVNFVSKSIAKHLNIHVDTHSSSISAINGTSTESKGITQITIYILYMMISTNV